MINIKNPIYSNIGNDRYINLYFPQNFKLNDLINMTS